MTLKFVVGDATNPESDTDLKIIAHGCNNVGAWGAGFVLALSRKWDAPEESYKELDFDTLEGGETQLVKCEPGIYVANIITQTFHTSHPVRYDWLRLGFQRLDYFARTTTLSTSIHMPRIGCGLGGGRWSVVESLIREYFSSETDITVYDLPKRG